jgi:hypothetical protein
MSKQVDEIKRMKEAQWKAERYIERANEASDPGRRAKAVRNARRWAKECGLYVVKIDEEYNLKSGLGLSK